LIKLVGKGATVSVCTTCVEARPYQPSGQSAAGFFHTKESELDVGDLVAGVKMGIMVKLEEKTTEKSPLEQPSQCLLCGQVGPALLYGHWIYL
jgi:hypothetical protein